MAKTKKGRHQRQQRGLVPHQQQLAQPLGQQPGQLVAASRHFVKVTSGPLPDPELLRHYDDIISNGAERIMQVFERQTDHRMDMEARIVRADIRIATLMPWLAFATIIAFLAVFLIIILFRRDPVSTYAGLGALILALATLAGIFLRHQRRSAQ